MKISFNITFILLIICINLKCLGQDQLLWRSSLENQSEDVFKDNYTRIAKGGFQLDLKELSNGKVLVRFDDLALLTQNILGGSDGMKFSYQSVSNIALDVFVGRNAIREQLRSQFQDNLEQKMSTMRFRGSSDDFKKEKTKDFEQILKGKKSVIYWRGYTWFVTLGTINDLNDTHPYNISFVCKNVPYAKLSFDSLYSDTVENLPQLNNEKCLPFDRYTYYKRYFGFSYEGLTYRPYRPTSGIARKKNFRLFFDKSSSSYHQDEINEIVKYLNDSNLVIQNAKVLAFASVEGDSIINMRLQNERAMVLIKTLEKANNDSIEINLETREDWGLFKNQLERTPFKDKYSQSDWKDLFENDSIEARFEKYLKQQRRAELFLTLTQRLTTEEKITVALGDFYRYSGQYNSKARSDVRLNIAKRLFAIKKYLEIHVILGNTTPDRICSLFPPNNNEYHIVQLYETAKAIYDGKEPVCENLDDLILAAHFSIIDLIQTQGESRLYLKQALDIQSFAYDMTSDGRLDPTILCKIDYPDNPAFYNLVLNKLYFEEHQGMSKTDNLPCDEASILDETLNNLLVSSTSLVNTPEPPGSFYYNFLKNIVLSGDERTKEYLQRSDHVYEFDLLEFLYLNISNWQAWDQKLFDEDITPEIMSLFLTDLMSMKNMICPNQLYSIAIDYHLKVLHHSLAAGEQNKLTNESLRFLSEYYQEHSDNMNDRLALAIAKQFMALTPLYFKNEPAIEAYDVLRRKDWKEPLKGEALNYYVNLVDIVAKDRDDRMEILKTKYPQDIWESFFTGKYSIYAQPSQ
ncbi:MAG: hypothetical protein O2887_07195 [Bacteroidetes bacterium]|nr:hypothetical protein [Bacteroidota bacterium]MDA1120265.1 hypothetical protein [Bacteroidota bacterium]